ncbi:MAG TPA: hypothetical protein VGN31_11785 [Paraburkholderia sp.]
MRVVIFALMFACASHAHQSAATPKEQRGGNDLQPTQVGVQVKLETFTLDDARAIRTVGFSFVRLGIWTNALHDKAYQARMRAAFDVAGNAGLPVVVTFRSTRPLSADAQQRRPDTSLDASARDFAAAVLDVAHEFRAQILAIELWNEPDLGKYWPTGDVATTFGPFMRTVCSYLAAQPHEVPVYGFGLSRAPAPGTLADSLLQATVGREPGCIDAISYHAYGMSPEAIEDASRNIRERYGMPAVITEWGVPSKGTLGGQNAQTRRVRDFLAALSGMRTPLVSIYEWKDTQTGTNLRERNYGLVVTAEQPKPALQAVRDALLRR